MAPNETSRKTRILRGKYRISSNVFVACHIYVLAATDTGVRAFLGLQKRADVQVPAGTRLYLDADVLHQPQQDHYTMFSTDVLAVETLDGQPLHVCAPVVKETHRDRRQHPRAETGFELILQETAARFRALNGSENGLMLATMERGAMLGLALDAHYRLDISYKNRDYSCPVRVRHIQYDWSTHTHRVGVSLEHPDEEARMVLRFLLDPDFTIDVSGTQIIDTNAAKVSRQDV